MVLSEEGGTRAGAAKFKTEPGSDKKKNVRKTGFQQRHSWKPRPASLEDRTSAMFSDLRPSTFKTTIKRLSGYAILKYVHYTGQAIQTRQPKVFNRPSKPSDGYMSDNPDGAKYLWQAKCKEIMVKKIGYTASLRKMFPAVLGCFNEDLRRKVKNWVDSNSLESDGDNLSLLSTIEHEVYGVRSAEYEPAAYHQAQVKIYSFSHVLDSRGHTFSNYLEHHANMVNIAEHARGKLDGVPALIVDTPGMRGLCGLFLQSAHEGEKLADIANYINPTLAE